MSINYQADPILKVESLKQYFRIKRDYTVKAVDGVSFEIYPGEVYGLVGESGSGKSTIGKSVIRLYTPTDGKIFFKKGDVRERHAFLVAHDVYLAIAIRPINDAVEDNHFAVESRESSDARVAVRL